MNRSLGRMLVTVGAMLGSAALAQHTIIDSNHSESYYFVDHYEVLIDNTPENIWPHLLHMRSWMTGIDMIHVSGPPNGEGAMFRLYEGQEFLFEITKLIPNRLILGLNHPSAMQGEESLGTAMFTLTQMDGQTLVSMFMSRYYNWQDNSPNPLRSTRETEEFLRSTREMHEGNLARLREVVEAQ